MLLFPLAGGAMGLEWSFDTWIQIPLYLLNGIDAHLFQDWGHMLYVLHVRYLMQIQFS